MITLQLTEIQTYGQFQEKCILRTRQIQTTAKKKIEKAGHAQDCSPHSQRNWHLFLFYSFIAKME